MWSTTHTMITKKSEYGKGVCHCISYFIYYKRDHENFGGLLVFNSNNNDSNNDNGNKTQTYNECACDMRFFETNEKSLLNTRLPY